MQYFILPVIMFVLSEMLGSVILEKTHIKSLKFNGIIGFSAIVAGTYVIYFPLVMLDVSFAILLIATVLFFSLLVYLIIRNFKSIKIHFSFVDILIVVLIFVIQVYAANRCTLGDLNAFDTVTYTNMISAPIYGDTINSIDWFNGFSEGFSADYSFQSFYKIESVLFYCINVICNFLHIEFFYFSQNAWFYSLLLYAFSSEMIINFIDVFKIKDKAIIITAFSFVVMFMGNFYWNSEMAYIGNSYRMIITSYSLLFIYLYFRDNYQNKYLLVLCILNYANAGCACCNTTLIAILVFFLWASIEDKNNSFKYILLSCYLPMINCLFCVVGYKFVAVIAITIMFGLAAVFENKITGVLNIIQAKKWLPILVGVTLIVLSYTVTGNLLDFSSFLDNYSGISDLTWDYTSFQYPFSIVANILYILLLLIALIGYRKDKCIRMITMILLIFFNPFATPIQFKYMIVYYRNYDLVINYFTLFIAYDVIDKYKNEILKPIVVLALLISSLYTGYAGFSTEHTSSFKKTENYDSLLKMDNDTVNAIRFMKEYLYSNGITECKVISSIYQIRTELPRIKTLYNRGNMFNGRECDKKLFSYFYNSSNAFNNYVETNLDYRELQEEIEKSDYDFIIQDTQKIVYDSQSDAYYPLCYILGEFLTPLYNNDGFVIYKVH